MGKRGIKLLVLVVVVALLAGACIILSSQNKSEETPVLTDETIVLASFADDAVTAFDYTYNSNTLSFTQVAGQWSYDGDAEFPLAQNSITTMLESVKTINASRKLDLADDFSSYGFDAPVLVLNITSGGNLHSFEVGDKNNYAGGYYLKYNDEIYIVDETLLTVFGKDLFDYLTITDLPDIEKPVAFVIDGVEYVDEGTVNTLYNAYSSLVRGDVADYRSKESYGFDGSEHTVVIKYDVNTAVTDENGNTTSTITTEGSYTFSYSHIGENAFIMLQDDDLIYSVSGVEAFELNNELSSAQESVSE